MVTTYDPEAACVVEQAQILEVNPNTYSCLVSTIHGHRNIPDVKFAVPVLHQNRGAGFNFMPEPGDICYVFTPADGTGSFVLGYVFLGDPDAINKEDVVDQDGPDYRGQRPKLLPGDMHLSTKDGNFIAIRKGGVIQIGASALAQRVYIPIENVIRDYFVRYHGFSPVGEIIWDHSQITSDDNNEDDVSAIVKFSCREKVADKKMSIEVRVGCLDKELLDATVNSNLIQEGIPTKVGEDEFTGAGDEEHLMGFNKKVEGLGFEPGESKSSIGLLSLVINPQGEGVKYTFQIDKDGTNFIRSEAHIHVECEQGFFVSAHPDDGVKLQTSSDVFLQIKDFIKAQVSSALMEILSNGDINVNGNNIQFKANGNIEMTATQALTLSAGTTIHLKAPDIKLGKTAAQDIIANASAWKAALEAHQHTYIPGTLPSAVTTPAGPVLPGAVTTSETPTKIKVG